MKRTRSGRCWFVLFIAMLLAAPPAAGAEELARVNGSVVTTEQFKAKIAEAPESMQARLATLEGRREVLDILIAREVLFQEAERQGLDQTPEGKEKLDQLRKNALIDLLIERLSASALKPAALRAFYNGHRDQFREVSASQILVPTEKEAKEIKKKLDAGADFDQLARALADEKRAGASGGDLGFFTRDRMLKAIADAAFAMKPKQVSAPIQTHYGYHLVKLTESREAPPFDQISDQMMEDVKRAALKQEVDRLREAQKVSVNAEALRKVR